MYNLMLVDADRDRTCLHKMNVITGDYLIPKYITGTFAEQAIHILDIIIKEKPDKIIFDKFGVGYGLYDAFMLTAKRSHIYSRLLEVDSFGLITYK